jgi:uncharacterized membrane protein YqiK
MKSLFAPLRFAGAILLFGLMFGLLVAVIVAGFALITYGYWYLGAPLLLALVVLWFRFTPGRDNFGA